MLLCATLIKSSSPKHNLKPYHSEFMRCKYGSVRINSRISYDSEIISIVFILMDLLFKKAESLKVECIFCLFPSSGLFVLIFFKNFSVIVIFSHFLWTLVLFYSCGPHTSVFQLLENLPMTFKKSLAPFVSTIPGMLHLLFCIFKSILENSSRGLCKKSL